LVCLKQCVVINLRIIFPSYIPNILEQSASCIILLQTESPWFRIWHSLSAAGYVPPLVMGNEISIPSPSIRCDLDKYLLLRRWYGTLLVAHSEWKLFWIVGRYLNGIHCPTLFNVHKYVLIMYIAEIQVNDKEEAINQSKLLRICTHKNQNKGDHFNFPFVKFPFTVAIFVLILNFRFFVSLWEYTFLIPIVFYNRLPCLYFVLFFPLL
jgi:hypothetical protein